MSRLLSLLSVLLFVFNVSLVAARPRQYLQHRSPTPVDVGGLNTNAKRFSRGLTPLPPLIKRKPTGIDAARRSATSQCAKATFIQVLDANTKEIKGYVSRDLKAGQRYTLTNLANAGVFSSSVYSSGVTTTINLLDVTDGSHYLAGLIKEDEQLGDGKDEDKGALLGRSFATDPGVSPQLNKDPSWNNHAAESAIWTYDHADDSLTATWVNYPGQTPSSTPVYIYWQSDGEKFFLTNSPTPPTQNSLAVLFKYTSIDDQCSNFNL